MRMLYIAIIAVMLLSLYAQSKVQRTFNKYLNEPAASGVTAEQMASEMMRRYGQQLPIHCVEGTLTDHFDPLNNTVGLSSSVYGSNSVSALAVAAHEIGHVLQYQTGYKMVQRRNNILPIARISSMFAPWIVIAGLFFQNYRISMIGVILFGTVLLFQLFTLPMELDASRRGLAMLQEGGYVSGEQLNESKEVLRAAAMTYVWATIASLISFLRLLSIANASRRN